MQEQLQAQSFFVQEREIEYMLAAAELLNPYKLNPKIAEVYDEAFVERVKAEYPMLFELFQGMHQMYGLGFFESVLGYEKKDFRIEEFFACLKRMPKEEVLSTFLQEPIEEIEKALQSEQEQIAFYQRKRESIQSYFSIEILFQKTEWFLDTYMKFVKELQTKKAEQYLAKQEQAVMNWKERIAQGVLEKGPLHYSEILMGKSFHNRGPYEKFYFIPAIFIPMMTCRWYGENQMLIFDCVRWDNPGDTKMGDMLKMLADKTRYKILVLLKERQRLNGVEIAEYMNLSTSTVSHHMTHLKNSGLVNEESAGNTKYYSLNDLSMKNCINILTQTFISE